MTDPAPTPPPSSGTSTRVRSGLIAAAIFVALLAIAELLHLGFAFMMLVALVAGVLGTLEFVGMALPSRPPGTRAVAIVLTSGLIVALGFGHPTAITAALVAAMLGATLWTLFTATATEGLADRAARLAMGILYIGVPVGLLPQLRSLPGGLGWLFLALGLGWCGDIGGYFAGRAFGRAKLAPMISPKKTWEGFVGGVLLALVWAGLFKGVFFPQMRLIDCLVLGVLGDTAGVLGDLVESVFKRSFGVKDSGRFLPGHGGFLDRVDSVMFAIAATWLYVVLFVPTAG